MHPCHFTVVFDAIQLCYRRLWHDVSSVCLSVYHPLSVTDVLWLNGRSKGELFTGIV